MTCDLRVALYYSPISGFCYLLSMAAKTVLEQNNPIYAKEIINCFNILS